MPPSPVEELALLDLDRSNKGASKQRRDQINAEISTMRDLLPLPETARQRLSQLQIMSLSCVYIRKCNVLQKLFRSFPAEKDRHATTCDFFQALTGFLLITTREGKLVYISENVTDYLGHSMVDMKTQGDSLYDIVDKRDHGTVQAQLLAGGADLDVTRDVAFFCRMNMSRTLKRQAGFGDVKVMHVRGHFIPLPEMDSDVTDQQQQPQQQQQQQQQQQKYVFMATCSPLITPELKENLIQSNTMVFKTVHQLDMKFLEVTKTAEYHLGYSTEEICSKSWYSMLHPEDIHEAKDKHVLLIRSSHEMGCMMTVRMLNAEGHVLWVNIVMHVRQAASTQNDDPLVICINQVISEEEAYQIRQQSHMFALYPPRSGDMWAAGLTAATSHPQHAHPPPHPDADTRWMIPGKPAPAPMVPSVAPGGAFQGPMQPYYMMGTQQRLPHPPMTCTTTSYPATQESSGYTIHPSSSSSSSSSSSPPTTSALNAAAAHLGGQTDKLKLMLKRKIQGPCRPAKVPKLVWGGDEGATDSGLGHSHQLLEFAAATADPMHSPDSASHFHGTATNVGYSWPAPSSSTQVIPRAQYRVAHVLPLTIQHQHNVKAAIMASAVQSPPSSLSPPHSATGGSSSSINTHVTSEQVVPDSSTVAVPESYLTPDPSPASSPQHRSSPHHVQIVPPAAPAAKTEPVQPGPKAAPTSTAILQELEKLASFSHLQNDAPTQTQVPAPALPSVVKLEKVPIIAPTADYRKFAGRQKELPIMDAFDIESFFDTLGYGELLSAVMSADSDEEQQEQAKAVSAVQNVQLPEKSRSLPVSFIKQEPLDAESGLLPGSSQQQQQLQQENQVQQQQVPAESSPTVAPVQCQPQSQAQVDPQELEELLSYFSGDMTATQLDLSNMTTTELALSDASTAPQLDMSDGLLSTATIKDEADVLVESAKAFSNRCRQEKVDCGAGRLNSFLFHSMDLERPLEDYSPVSSLDNNSDLSCDDEDSSAEDSLQALLETGQSKPDGGDPCAPSSLSPPQPQTPQDVPGICEEDELYQLDKLLSTITSIASNNGLMVYEQPQ